MGWQDAPLAEPKKKSAWQDAPLANAPVASDDPGAGKGWAETGAEWRSLPERMLPGVRPAAIAAGASAGAMMSLPAAPALGPLAPFAPVVGGALGAGAASAGYDNISDLLTQIIPGFKPLPDATTGGADAIAGRAADEAALDAAFTAGTGILGFPQKHFISPLIGKVFGVRNPASMTLQQIAQRQGIQLGAVDVGNAAPRTLAKILGVFPITGTPLQYREVYERGPRSLRHPILGKKYLARTEGQIAKEAQLRSAVARTLNRVAPTATMSAEMGIDIAKAATQTRDEFLYLSNQMYDAFRINASQKGTVIPSSEALSSVNKWIKAIEEGEVRYTPSGADGAQTLGANTPFENFLFETREALSQNPRLTMAQYESVEQKLEQFIDKANPDAFTIKRVAEIKQAMERDLNAIADPGLKRDKDLADTFFSNGIVIFQTPVGQKFKLLDKNIFGHGPAKPGTLNADELFRPIFNMKSATAQQQLRALVGDEVYTRASRTYLQEAMDEAWKPVMQEGREVMVFRPDEMANKIGLGGGRKDQRAALAEVLRGSGVEVRDLEDLLQRIKVTQITDPTVWMGRRVTMGGVRAIMGLGGLGLAAVGGTVAGAAAAGPAGAMGGSWLAAALATWGARNFSKLLASPESLKALTRSFHPEVNDVTRRAVYYRLLREFGDVEQQ
jgi:hypothetical protein